jgi:hypothetical protein
MRQSPYTGVRSEEMNKTKLFVFLGLMMLFVSGTLFAGGIFQRGDQAVQGRVADAVDVAEVPDMDFLPRRNPATARATGSVYALPAEPLLPEDERLPPPVYAISGVKGVEISEGSPWEVVDIIVNLPERESFSRGILEGQDVSGWITNLPAGLEAKAHGVKKGAVSVKIYISGTPAVTGRELIRVNIPGTYLTGGTARQFVSPTEEESQKTWEDSQIN